MDVLSQDESRHLVVMGVAGSGKSTVARRLATELDLEFGEGDDFHPESNIDKMRSGHPLTDEDRWAWLEALAAWTAEHEAAGGGTVLTCSALKRAYRDVLRTADPATYFVHLYGTEALLRDRMDARDHFMPASLLRSQLDALEPLERDELGIEVDVAGTVEAIVARVLADLGTH